MLGLLAVPHPEEVDPVDHGLFPGRGDADELALWVPLYVTRAATSSPSAITSWTTPRPPTQGQVGEARHQPQEAANVPAVADDARRPPTASQVGEPWRQTSGPGRPAEPGGRLGRRIASLGFLAAALTLVGGLAVLAATRPGRRPRAGQPT